MQTTLYTVPIVFTIGLGLMFAPYHSAQIVSFMAFLIAAIWAAGSGIMWARNVRKWGLPEIAKTAGIVAFVMLITPTMMYFAWPAGAQTPPPAPSVIQQTNQTAPNLIVPGNNNQFNFAPQHSEGPHDNTFAGQVPPGVAENLSQGHDNTYAGATDSNEKAIYNKGGTAIGSHACAGPTDVVIGSHAGSQQYCNH
jgi:hypothetical protein